MTSHLISIDIEHKDHIFKLLERNIEPDVFNVCQMTREWILRAIAEQPAFKLVQISSSSILTPDTSRPELTQLIYTIEVWIGGLEYKWTSPFNMPTVTTRFFASPRAQRNVILSSLRQRLLALSEERPDIRESLIAVSNCFKSEALQAGN